MKEIIDLNNILDDFIKPQSVIDKVKKQFTRTEVLQQKVAKGMRLRDMINFTGWQRDMKEIVVKSLKQGIGTLLRPSSLEMSESEIKSIMAGMQSKLGDIAEIMYHLEEGREAQAKLGKMK